MVKLILLSVVMLMIIGNITTLKIRTGSDRGNFSDQHQKVIKILKQCFRNKLTTIIAVFKSSQCVIDFRKELPDTSIILVNNGGTKYNQKWLFSKAPIYVLETGSEEDLGDTLTTLQLLPWWGRSALFFLIGSSNNSCIDAKKILSTMWTEKISSTIYVCHDNEENNYKIFTSNPFTNRAPDPWKLSGDNFAGRWTLYEQPIQDTDETCSNLMFDKTKYLDGYEIKAMITHQIDDGVIRNSSLDHWTPVMTVPSGPLISDISKRFNVSISVKQDKGGVVSYDYYVEPLQKLKSNEYDIYLNIRPIFLSYPHKTRPVFRMAMSIFTHRRPFLRPEEKILMFYFNNNVLFICLVAFLVLVSAKVLQMNKKQSFSTALIKMWHSLLNVAVREPLKKFWIRFYFVGIFMLFIVMSESFKGNLISFLTKPERLEVNSIKDLIDLRYHAYLHKFFQYYKCCGFETIPAKRLHFFNEDNCASYINDQTACITHDVKLRKIIEASEIHVSTESIFTDAVWMVSPQFPLKRKFDTAILRCFQSGIIDVWYDWDWQRKIKKIRAIEAKEVEAQFRAIELDDLLFAFKLLIIGLSCSLVVFIIEICHRRSFYLH